MTFIDIIVPADQTEGTRFVLKSWLKSAGSTVSRDEPIAEIETDKVTMEVPAPASGTLGDDRAAAGIEVKPGMVIGRVGVGDEQETSPSAAAGVSPKLVGKRVSFDPALRLSPSVRRLIAEHGCDPSHITGTGRDGRITHTDVLAYLDRASNAPTASSLQSTGQPAALQGGGSRMVPHSGMRRAIAEHMQCSVTVAPHVTAVVEADFTAIVRDRDRRKAGLKQQNISLTYTAYFVAACVHAIRAVPVINSRWHDDALETFDDMNIGIGTALGDGGLVVPVIHKAQDLTLDAIAGHLADITTRARNHQLRPADTQAGTFTISNHGVSGSLLATPIIIHQPQSAILGIGKLEKRVVVRKADGGDVVAIRPMAYISLTIDHRVLDGQQANAFLKAWVETIEGWA